MWHILWILRNFNIKYVRIISRFKLTIHHFRKDFFVAILGEFFSKPFTLHLLIDVTPRYIWSLVINLCESIHPEHNAINIGHIMNYHKLVNKTMWYHINIVADVMKARIFFFSMKNMKTARPVMPNSLSLFSRIQFNNHDHIL